MVVYTYIFFQSAKFRDNRKKFLCFALYLHNIVFKTARKKFDVIFSFHLAGAAKSDRSHTKLKNAQCGGKESAVHGRALDLISNGMQHVN